MDLGTPLSQALSTTKSFLEILGEMGIGTVEDLLLHFPRAHESLRDAENDGLSETETNEISGVFVEVRSEKTRTGKTIVRGTLENGLEAVWFNQPYLKGKIPIGRPVRLIGKAKLAFGRWSLQSPRIEIGAEIDAPKTASESENLIPVYASHEKLTSHWLREKIASILHLASKFAENLPAEVVNAEGLMTRSEAIRAIHAPQNRAELARARERLAFEELFAIQTASFAEKQAWQTAWAGEKKRISLDPERVKKFLETLQFSLTTAQKIALFEILKDLDRDFPMMRLLEGDVGSGKTVVAAAAAAMAIDAGFQVAVMAPTEVLARQLFSSIQKMLEKYGDAREKPISTALLIGALKPSEKRETTLAVAAGLFDAVIGTHALVQESVDFSRLGLAIVDEQHRFGVAQRDRFKSFGSPHLLHMTATPIPRSLALVAYGDHDLSVIAELPPGRTPIETRVVPHRARREVERFIELEIENGRQVFVICPLVSESETIEAKAAIEEFSRLSTDIFPHIPMGLMHGRLSSTEKEAAMDDFRSGKTKILVSTSVVEVGVDVPNASIMLIEGAERFGLSQLHQFRGRVGRGAAKSFCFLFVENETQSAQMRLTAMEQTTDGFRLAEIDMRLRGPGEVYGVRQSGIPNLKIADLSDALFVDRVKKAVAKAHEQQSAFQ